MSCVATLSHVFSSCNNHSRSSATTPASLLCSFLSHNYSKVVLKGREGRGEKMNTEEEIGGRRGEKAGGKEIMTKMV